MTLCIAAAQTQPTAGDVAANIAEHLHLVELAATRGRAELGGGPSLLLFPELSLTGYELALGPTLAFTRDDPRLAPLRAAASQHDMTLVVGAPVREDHQLYIAALCLGPAGSVRLYTKHHLGSFGDTALPDLHPRPSAVSSLAEARELIPPPESAYFAPGRLAPQLQVSSEHKAALAICADTGQPSHLEAALAAGANLYLASMFVSASAFAGEFADLRRRTTAAQVALALANYGAPSGGLQSGGCSSMVSPSGELVVQLPAGGSGVSLMSHDSGEWRGAALQA